MRTAQERGRRAPPGLIGTLFEYFEYFELEQRWSLAR